MVRGQHNGAAVDGRWLSENSAHGFQESIELARVPDRAHLERRAFSKLLLLHTIPFSIVAGEKVKGTSFFVTDENDWGTGEGTGYWIWQGRGISHAVAAHCPSLSGRIPPTANVLFQQPAMLQPLDTNEAARAS